MTTRDGMLGGMTEPRTGVLEPALLTMYWDEGLPTIPGYVRVGVHWNGFECPTFDLDVLRAHRDELARLFPADEGADAFSWDADDMPHRVEHWDDEPDSDAVGVRVMPDGRTLVDIGSWSYVWEIAA